MIPVLETARLRLRAHTREDFQAVARSWADPRVVRYIGGKPSTGQQSWNRLMHFRGHWELQGFGYWAVEEKSTGLYVGDVGIADFHREIEPSLEGLPELGWVLAPEAHGKGYATEAVCAAIAWGETHLPALIGSGRPLRERRMMAIIDTQHKGSIRVAEKCGFKECARTKFLDEPVIMFERRF